MMAIKRPVRATEMDDDGIRYTVRIFANVGYGQEECICYVRGDDEQKVARRAREIVTALNAQTEAGDVEALAVKVEVDIESVTAKVIERLQPDIDRLKRERDEAVAREAQYRGALEQAIRLLNTIGASHELYEYQQAEAALAAPPSEAVAQVQAVIDAARRTQAHAPNIARDTGITDALRALDGGGA